MLNNLKKSLVILTAASVIGSNLILALPAKAQVGPEVPVSDSFSHTLLDIVAGNTGGEFTQDLYEWAETFVRATLKKALLDRLVDQIVNFIQGNGEPKFVTDWAGFLEEAGQEAAGEFAKALGLGFLCSPFSLQVRIALLPVPKFAQRASCTLDQIVGNIERFYEDFRNGSWIAYQEGWQPQNNFYGAFLVAWDERQNQIARAVNAALNEATAGGGFLSVKQCDKDAQGNIKPETCRIVTPGRAVGDSLAQAIGADFQFIATADQLGEYAAAITNALINRIIKEGVTGLRSITSRSQQEQAISNNNRVTQNNFEFLRNNLISQIDTPLTPRQNAQALLDITIANLKQFKDTLTSIFNQLTTLSPDKVCVAGSPPLTVKNVKDAIVSELAQAQVNITQLESDRAGNKLILDKLVSAKSQLQALSNTNENLVKLTAINNDIAPVLSPAIAITFKTNVENQTSGIQSNINSKTATFNQNLDDCKKP